MLELRFHSPTDRLAASTFAPHYIMLIPSSEWKQRVVVLVLFLGLQAASAVSETGEISAPNKSEVCTSFALM
jgi:hypothetical protein